MTSLTAQQEGRGSKGDAKGHFTAGMKSGGLYWIRTVLVETENRQRSQESLKN